MFHCKCVKRSCIMMWADATVAHPYQALLQLLILLYFRQLNKEYKTLLVLQVNSYSRKRRDRYANVADSWQPCEVHN